MARILVIDDDDLVCEVLQTTLAEAGHEPMIATSGPDGVAYYRDRAFDVVIADIFMPEQDGLETIDELRRLDPSVKVIAITAGSPIRKTNALNWATAYGAKCGFRKPLDHRQLLSAIDGCVGGHSVMDEVQQEQPTT